MPPHSLFHDGIHIRQLVAICKVGKPVNSNDRIQLCSRPLLDVWVQCHRHKERTNTCMRLQSIKSSSQQRSSQGTMHNLPSQLRLKASMKVRRIGQRTRHMRTSIYCPGDVLVCRLLTDRFVRSDMGHFCQQATCQALRSLTANVLETCELNLASNFRMGE